MILTYEKFNDIFNREIFEKSKSKLLENISNNPSRYIGLFRPTKPKGKILQNLLQSHEIRMGNAFEELLGEYLKMDGFTELPKSYTYKENKLEIDQCFKKGGKVYLIEQKIRDDHDSSKKRGQIQNFEDKIGVMINNYEESSLIVIFYFIDPDMDKNKKYYGSEISKLRSSYNIQVELFYGSELFNFIGNIDAWNEILEYLERWKEQIPDIPEINFDIEAEKNFEEIKDLSPRVYRKLFSDDKIFDQIILTIFPEKKTLQLLSDYFENKDQSIYKYLASQLTSKLSGIL